MADDEVGERVAKALEQIAVMLEGIKNEMAAARAKLMPPRTGSG